MSIRALKEKYQSLDTGNITAFVKGVQTAFNGDDTPDSDLRSYLDVLIDEFEPEGRRICTTRPVSKPDRDLLTVGTKVLACQMLVLAGMKSAEALRDRAMLFLQYGAAVVGSRYDILPAALKVMCYRMESPGLDWLDILNALSPDILVYKFIRNSKFLKEQFAPLHFPVRGTVEIRDGKLTLSTVPGIEAGAEAFRTAGDCVAVYSRSTRDVKLKSSDREEIDAVAEFASRYLSALNSMRAWRPGRREPVNGDTVDIIYCWTKEEGCFFRVLDDEYPLQGQLLDEELVAGLTSGELEEYIYEDDCISGAKLIRDGDSVQFSIRSCYLNFATKAANAACRENRTFYARVTHVREDIGRINWITPFGFGAVSNPLTDIKVEEGKDYLMEMMNVMKNGTRTYINIRRPMYSADDNLVRMEDGNEEVLKGFVQREGEIRTRQEQEQKAAASSDLPKRLLDRVASILVSGSSFEVPMERYRMLLAAAFLYRMNGNEGQLQALLPEAFWLRCCISFAQGKTIPARSPYGDLSADRKAVLECLASFSGRSSDLPAEAWDAKVATLVEAYHLSRQFPDEIQTDVESVRHRICDLLGVTPAFRATGERRNGKYGVERQTVEFKSSYVMSNDGTGADIDRQGRGQVFEAVCGFLNAEGGVLYLGVNDAGEPIVSEDLGLKGDMAWLCANFASLSQSRKAKLGHSVMKPDTLDHFVLFLRSEKELYFSESVQGLITIEATEDMDAIRFTVRPSEFEIAYLYSDKTHTDGVAYVRDGNSTVPMSDLSKRQRLMSLKSIDKEMGFVVTIREAIDQHRKLTFKDYSSSNSGKVADRHVVPINLMYNDENVYCYDLDAHKPKQFRLHRISSIEPYGDDPYTLPANMKPKKADVFRWMDGERYHIRIRMSVAARNYLLEEYSDARNLPPEEFYPDPESPDKWILDTTLHGLGAIRRFYLGLADKMEILDSEDSEALKEDIRKYMGDYLKGFI